MNCAVAWSPPSSALVHRPGRVRRWRSSVRPCAAAVEQEGGAAGEAPRLVLHDSLDSVGVATAHARAAREGFVAQVGRLTRVSAGSSIAISRGPDLARAALCVAAEDDSLVSHSSVPLPVDAFIARLDDLSTGFCAGGNFPPSGAPPEVFFDYLNRYLYVHKGFRRTNGVSDVRIMYLHSVLTCRSGSALMLALIYSEILKTTLRTLKCAFWPFQSDQSSSLFLNAVAANQRGPGTLGDNQARSYGNTSAIEMAAAKAAQHRLMRGVWTNARFGDMRRALAACERLILLHHDPHELRDYAALLYHCGYYEDCLHYLSLYQTAKSGKSPTNRLEILEDEAVNTLKARLMLILAEDGWSRCRPVARYWTKNSEPW
ncbi:hypothetical protein ZEAMMB73_Zm00001d040383 [Zea mays]|uniref:Protein SirB1 N-terminal domain-containing protein n=1 Tax=Zea mays TaxID=4577 RepID=A0A1D6MQH4_MAIZE|nr:hypothetical protein ZEAMMB73_Zm00001d040383 [Zea mays]